jgi:hypothetical protein
LNSADVPEPQVQQRGLSVIHGHVLVAWSVLAASIAYSWFAAGSRPFATASEIYCAVAFAAVGAAIVFWHRFHRPQPTTGSGYARPPATAGSLQPWIVVLCVFIAWELATYFVGISGNRHDFPTISSLYDDAARFRAAKAFLFFLWLTLGWRLLRA